MLKYVHRGDESSRLCSSYGGGITGRGYKCKLKDNITKEKTSHKNLALAMNVMPKYYSLAVLKCYA